MGNTDDLNKNENIRINPNEIIENDCYEEVDLKKINKIIEEEKNWNKNSIIYTLNAPELKLLTNDNEDQNQNEMNKNENEKRREQEEVFNKVIEEQKNEDESEEMKIKENNEIPQNNNIENNNTNEIKDNQKIENEKQENTNLEKE